MKKKCSSCGNCGKNEESKKELKIKDKGLFEVTPFGLGGVKIVVHTDNDMKILLEVLKGIALSGSDLVVYKLFNLFSKFLPSLWKPFDKRLVPVEIPLLASSVITTEETVLFEGMYIKLDRLDGLEIMFSPQCPYIDNIFRMIADVFDDNGEKEASGFLRRQSLESFKYGSLDN